MNLFCKHKNVAVIAKTYAPGRDLAGGRIRGYGVKELLLLEHGCTTILLKCLDCGKIWKKELVGREVNITK